MNQQKSGMLGNKNGQLHRVNPNSFNNESRGLRSGLRRAIESMIQACPRLIFDPKFEKYISGYVYLLILNNWRATAASVTK